MAASMDYGESNSPGSQDGMISGGIMGGLLSLILLIVLFMCCVRKKAQKRSRQEKKLGEDSGHHEPPVIAVDTLAVEEPSAADSSPETILRSLNVDVPLPRQRRISGYNNRSLGDLQPIKSKMTDNTLETAIESYKIDEKRLKLEGIIGRGSFSLVYNGKLYDKSLKEHQLVTVKTVHGTGCTPSILKSFVEQGMILREYEHPNILNILGLVIQDDQPFLAFPRMDKGNLRNYLTSPQMHFTAKTLIQMGMQVAEAMQYLANQAFVHKDIATRNCVVDEDGLVKVGDSALSRDMFEADYFLVEELSPDPLPIAWMAVETLTQLTYSLQTDVWSFGVLLWELITRGQAPFSDMDGATIIALVRTGQRLERPVTAPTSLYELMQKCWEENPSSRPSFNAICEKLNHILEGPKRAKTSDYKKVIRASNF